MLRKSVPMSIVLSFIGVLAAETLVHWFLASNAIPLLRRLYLSNSKLNSITMLVDDFGPAIVLGLINGWLGYRWPVRILCVSAVLLGMGVVGSQSLYQLFFTHDLLWWWPWEAGEVFFWFVTALGFLGLFTYQGRIFRLWSLSRK